MNRPTLVFIALVALAAASQTRTDTFEPTELVVTEMVLKPLADGGCSARWCGVLPSTDGGVTLLACTAEFELKATVNLNRCAGLAAAGVNRVGRALRLDLDAGAQ
jgi:hypothetical protein